MCLSFFAFARLFVSNALSSLSSSSPSTSAQQLSVATTILYAHRFFSPNSLFPFNWEIEDVCLCFQNGFHRKINRRDVASKLFNGPFNWHKWRTKREKDRIKPAQRIGKCVDITKQIVWISWWCFFPDKQNNYHRDWLMWFSSSRWQICIHQFWSHSNEWENAFRIV